MEGYQKQITLNAITTDPQVPGESFSFWYAVLRRRERCCPEKHMICKLCVRKPREDSPRSDFYQA